MKNAVSYPQDLTAFAKSKKLRLCTIDYNGKPINAERMTFQVAVTPRMVPVIEKFMADLLEAWGKDKADGKDQ